ncbi:16295_t:CDS:2, partial [Gigaspora margarita]
IEELVVAEEDVEAEKVDVEVFDANNGDVEIVVAEVKEVRPFLLLNTCNPIVEYCSSIKSS